jgi:hypothetical protein
MYSVLHTHFSRVSAFEPEFSASSALHARGYAVVYSSEEEAFNTPVVCIGAFDVVEHIGDDRAFLTKAHRALVPGGTLVITVPAFMFLWGPHDVNHHHFRRYRRDTLKKLLAECGFELPYASYWNCMLFIPAAVLRLLGQTGESGLTLPRALDALFFAVVYVECCHCA